MEYFEKTVNYFKYFDDIKLFENDNINNKIAIVFYGKENMIHIFDLKPYTQYLPFHKKNCEHNLEEDNIRNSENMALSNEIQL